MIFDFLIQRGQITRYTAPYSRHAARRAIVVRWTLLANAIASIPSTVTEASFSAPGTLPLARPRAALCFFASCAARLLLALPAA